MAVSLTEYLDEIQKLTKKNLEILKALNDSFYTKSEHLSVSIDNTDYVIPSFISLENKLNSLEDNFENLVNAPRTGEAVFNFNGNTQEIQVKGFTNVPGTAFEGLDMENVASIKTFGVEKNNIFKDFLTPTPFIKIDLSNLPDDIQQVNVKKIAVSNSQLISLLKANSGWKTADPDKGTVDSVCRPISYADTVKKLYSYSEPADYVEYDKVYTLPIRYELGSGKYNILKIVNNYTDDNFFEHYELELDNLVYRIADETIERNILQGDYLITNNDKVKLLVENVNYTANRVTVKVENGGFSDLCTVDDGNVDLSTLKFYALGSIDNSKYLKIPLEEDEYILVFLAPIQRNSLIQSAWSNGLFFNVSNLQNQYGERYEDYYKEKITNIGDKLFGIVSMASKDFVNVGEEEFKTLTESKPVIDPESLKVVLINKHLSNSETVQEIYNLYRQKEDYKKELNTIQKQIDELKEIINSISFETMQNERKVYEAQLKTLNEQKKTVLNSITDAIQQISVASTDTDTPVENPKYHIRGFFDYQNYLNSINMVENGKNKHNVIKIDVQYRYKNATKTTGNAETIQDNIFSDWNVMDSFVNEMAPQYGYTYNYPGDTSKINEPSFNQIDIPITQGETVDIRLRTVYGVGYPFVKTVSAWSDILNVEFPVELRKNITVIDIIEENNSDAKKEAFRGYLEKQGVIEHIEDKTEDQDLTYFHVPEHISSGFFTAERRIIPLSDKLNSITNDIISLQDEIYGTNSNNILVTLSDGESEIIVNPFSENLFVLKDYSSADKDAKNKVNSSLVLNIQNNSSKNSVKLFSLFPGNYFYPVKEKSPNSKFENKEYYVENSGANVLIPTYISTGNTSVKSSVRNTSISNSTIAGSTALKPSAGSIGNALISKPITGGTTTGTEISGEYQSGLEVSGKYINEVGICVPIYSDLKNPSKDNKYNCTPQVQNQWIYFRIYDPYNNDQYFRSYKSGNKKNMLCGIHKNGVISEGMQKGLIAPESIENGTMYVFPHVSSMKEICITENDSLHYKILYPGESLQVPLSVLYKLSSEYPQMEKTLCFDLRNSLYSDPLSYKVQLKAKFSNDLSNKNKRLKLNRYKPVVIN